MAITVTAFPLGWVNMLEQNIDVEGANTLRLTLHTTTMAANVDTWDFEADLTDELTTAVGYTVGGVTLTNVTWSHDATTDQIRLDFDDPSWTFTGAGPTWRYGVVWINTAGADTTDPLLLLLDWGASQTVSGVYTITLDAAGIYAIDMT
jgi:hypothetical protein